MTPEEQQRLRQMMAQGVPEDIGTPDLGKTLDIVNRGYIGGLLGGFPDIANTALNALVPGYNVEVPVGGTEWWGQQMQDAGMVSDKRYPAEELLAGLVNPIPAGIFAGKGAKMADMAKLLMAEGMLAKGDDAADVFQSTGWLKGLDGKWKFEIPDNTFSTNWTALKERSPYIMQSRGVDFVDHGELKSNYPDVNDMVFSEERGGTRAGTQGAFSGNTVSFTSDAPDDVILHELQHAIQEGEGFARGGSPNNLNPFEILPEEFKTLSGVVKRTRDGIPGFSYTSNTGDTRPISNDEALRWFGSQYGLNPEYELYKRLAGEAEARLTQYRMNLTPQERLAQYPYDPEYFEQATGVPIDRLIYRYNE